MVLKNRRLTIRDVADSLQISFGSVQAILKNDLGLRRVKSRMVPKTLNFFDKERRVKICETMLSDYQDVMKRIISGDETWIYAYDYARITRLEQKVRILKVIIKFTFQFDHSSILMPSKFIFVTQSSICGKSQKNGPRKMISWKKNPRKNGPRKNGILEILFNS